MNEDIPNDWLDTRLRDEASYIDDAGFSALVIQKLPARRVRRSYRAVILLALTVVASALAYFLSGSGGFVGELMMRFAVMPLSLMYLGAMGIGLLVMIGGIFAAISKSGQHLR
ncbi:MAG: hypothetical protein ABJB09_02295 [Verrucomicrobiota bacterium]